MGYRELSTNLSGEDGDLRTETNKFASEVIRPISLELDRMTAKEALAAESPFWTFMRKAYELDYHKLLFPEKYGGSGLAPLQMAIVMEELAWGSLGLAQALNTSSDAFMAMGGTQEQIAQFTVPYCECRDGTYIGCWGLTEPDHGSDAILPDYPGVLDESTSGQCKAIQDGNEWIIQGQKSIWTSAGTIAKNILLTCEIHSNSGNAGKALFIFSLDRPGVSRDEPLEKIGMREMNHGRITFKDVRVPKESLLIGQEGYVLATEGYLCLMLPAVAIWCTGLARAGFEEALTYAKKRIQGGKRIIEHKSVQQKVFAMFCKVEASRQLSRAAFTYNWSNPPEKRSLEQAIAAKTYASQAAMDVTSDAIQIFGGIGISKEYLIEKLFRDARTTLMCYGSNDVLAVKGGDRISASYR